MAQRKDILFFFPRRFQSERYEKEIKKLDKERDLKEVSHLPKSYSAIVSFPKQFVPVLKPKKPLCSSVTIGQFSLDKKPDCENSDKNEIRIKKSKSYEKKKNCKLNEYTTRTEKKSKDDHQSSINPYEIFHILNANEKHSRCSQMVLKHLYQRNDIIIEHLNDDCKDNESSDDD